jgi:hypothetical protein
MNYSAMSSLELVCNLVADNPIISAVHLFKPFVSPPIQDMNGLTQGEQSLIADALNLRSSTQFPFWECLMQLISVGETDAPTLITMATRHNPQSVTLERVLRDEVTIETLITRIESLSEKAVLALSSNVQCSDGQLRHFPMLDFHCKMSTRNDLLVKRVAEALGIRGYLAHSGQSYHFYGAELLTEDQLISFLSRALLYSPITDRAWIAHQLIERACGLRISPGKEYRACPIVFSEV